MKRRTFLQGVSASAAIGPALNVIGANETVTVGVIGTGGRGQQLLKTMTNIPAIRVAAVSDLRDDRMASALRICEDQYKSVKAHKDFRRLLDQEKLDACVVATEVGNHALCVIPVLERGLHCFSEKPMESTVEKTDRIVKLARQTKAVYQAGFQRRYAPGFQKAVGAVHSGMAGKVRYLQGQWHWDWGESGWCLDAEISGGELVEQACHHMDVMQWVMKGQHPVKCVAMGLSSFEEKVPSGYPSEDHSSIAFQFADGTVFSYTQVFDTCTQFTGEKLWVYGSKGGMDLVESMYYPKPDQGEPKQVGEKSPGWAYGTPHELEAFTRHIKNNETPLSNVETARISTLISIMGRKAMYDWDKRSFEPRVVSWEHLGSVT